MRNMQRPAPAPVTIFRPDAAGSLVLSEVIQPTEYRRFDSGYENEIEIRKYRLIAIQETGEEMSAGYASNWTQSLDRKYAWLDSHPEHRDVLIEEI